MSKNLVDRAPWSPPTRDTSPVVSTQYGIETSSDFYRLVHQLMDVLPDKSQVINLCGNRLCFAASFCASLFKQNTNLLPQNRQARTLEELYQRFENVVSVMDPSDLITEPAGMPIINVAELAKINKSTEQKNLSIDAKQMAAKVYTSGSTGTPKELQKPWHTLIGTALKLSQRLNCDAWEGPILATVPCQHMYGLEMTLLLALATKLSVLEEMPFYPADVAEIIAAQHCPVNLVTTPFHLKSLLDLQRRDLRVANIICATSPLSRELAERAEHSLGATVTEIFGCSEAGSLASRRPSLSDIWELLDGFNLYEKSGEFWLAADHLSEPVKLEDRIEFLSTTHFRLLGRSANMLNVAGKRSSIDEITAKLLTIDGVEDAAVFVPSGMEGSGRPAALVVSKLDSKSICQRLTDSLDPVFIPRPLKCVAKVPRNATGKLLKHDLEKLI